MKKLAVFLLLVIASSFFFFESNNDNLHNEARENLIKFVISIKEPIDTDKYTRALKANAENSDAVVNLKYVIEEDGNITAEGVYNFKGECREIRMTWEKDRLFIPKLADVSKNKRC